jgi:dTDP-glucose 4,6-dehydratase
MGVSQPKGTVLITGAAGFLGSHLAERFLAERWTVIGVDNLLTGTEANIAHLASSGFRLIRHDVTQPLTLDDPVSLVLHFASPASPSDYLRHPIHTMKVESLGTLHTLGLARARGARYLLASTSEVYGNPQVHPQPETYWGHVNPLGPRSVYDEGKRFAEALAMAYHRTHGLDVRIARIFNTYGPRMRRDDGRVIPTFLTCALEGRPLPVHGDGRQTRSFCYVDDLVEVIYRLATMEGLGGQVFNVGNPDERTILELAQIIRSLAGRDPGLVFLPLPADDPTRRCPDISRVRAAVGWEPQVPLEEGLRRTLAWFARQGVSSVRPAN